MPAARCPLPYIYQKARVCRYKTHDTDPASPVQAVAPDSLLPLPPTCFARRPSWNVPTQLVHSHESRQDRGSPETRGEQWGLGLLEPIPRPLCGLRPSPASRSRPHCPCTAHSPPPSCLGSCDDVAAVASLWHFAAAPSPDACGASDWPTRLCASH